MFNKFALVITGLMLTVSSVGCCCFGGYGYGTGYGMRGGCPPCNNGCAPMGGAYYQPPQQGAFYQGDTSQTAFATGGYTTTALAPTQSAFVPTSTAALMPGAIQGPPIYNTAVLPGSTLPVY